ncbi:hypothetical protein HKD37_06G015850 [Glycine soja]
MESVVWKEMCDAKKYNTRKMYQVIRVWEKILRWIGYVHTPTMWDDELGWIVENTKGKGCKRSLMKLVVAETVYRVWFVRNRIIFQDGRKEELHWETIKNVILRRVENNRKLMMYCNRNL